MKRGTSFVLYLWTLLSTLCLVSGQQKLINRTIDDQFGDEVTGRLVEYAPAVFWTQGNACRNCAFHPDNGSTFDHTWHDGSRVPANQPDPLTFSFKFNGTAVYVFNILVKEVLTDVNITLDGQFASHFSMTPDIGEQYLYDYPIFTQENVPYGEHTVEVSAFGSGPNTTIVYFDYAIYTTSDTPGDTGTSSITNVPPGAPSPTHGPGTGASNDLPSTSHKTSVGAIAGGVVGGVVLLLALLLAFLWHRKSRKAPAVLTPFQSGETRRKPDISDDDYEVGDKSPGILAEKAGYGVQPVIWGTSSAGPSDSVDPVSTGLTEDALRESVNALREHFAAVRAGQSKSGAGSSRGTTSSSSSRANKSPASVALQNEIQSLWQEIEQLRAQQEHRGRDDLSVASSSVTTELLREMAVLRAEIDELREQQDRGELPGYSPPAQPFPRPLPQVIASPGPYTEQ